jgi:hypothetical protein
MAREIHFSIQQGDVTQFEADVIALKYAEGLFGASQTVAKAIGENEETIKAILPSVGDAHLIPSQGRIKAKKVLFLSVVSLSTFDYIDIHQFGYDVLKKLQSIAPETQHLALTIHGIGFGMNPANSLRSELGGCIEAIKAREFPRSLEKITIIDRNAHFVNQLKTALSKFMPTQKIELADPAIIESSQELSPNSSKKSDGIIDVFISYKSEDTEYAKEVYEYLTSQNFQVFFSKESLPQLGSDEYHEQIDIAIERTRHMVVVSSRSENVLAKWVKYEWRLFLGEKLAGRKPGNLVTVIAGDMKIKDLPIALRNREVITLNSGEIEKLQKYIKQDTSAEAPSPEANQQENHGILPVEPEYSSQLVGLSDFTVAKTEILNNTSWDDAKNHSKTLTIGERSGWNLPTLEQLSIIRKSSLFPNNYCYWSEKEADATEAFYMHFDDGHIGRGPKTFNSGLCAVFVQKKPDF